MPENWMDQMREEARDAHNVPERFGEPLGYRKEKPVENLIFPGADGFIIIHHRASGSSSLYFGPFASVEEARAWVLENDAKGVSGYIVPVYKSVDWSR